MSPSKSDCGYAYERVSVRVSVRVGEGEGENGCARESSVQGEGALPLMQLSVCFLISCLEKHDLYFIFFPTAKNKVD